MPVKSRKQSWFGGKYSAGMQPPLMHVYRALPSPQVNWDGSIVIRNFSLYKKRFVKGMKQRAKRKLCTMK